MRKITLQTVKGILFMNCRKKMLLSWKVENIPDELSGLDKEIARKTIKGAPWFLLAA